MKVVLQRVLESKVLVDGQVLGEIGKGLLVLLGVCNEDSKDNVDKLVEKISKLRIFGDEFGKTNLSSVDVNAEILIVSQFTLYADCKKGNRPSFVNAGSPHLANNLYEYFIEKSKKYFTKVQCGSFGADMKVSLINDGPFTIVLED